MPLDLNIPATSPWRDFDAENFVSVLAGEVLGIEEACSGFSEATAAYGQEGEPRKAIFENGLQIAKKLRHVYAHLKALREPNDELREELAGGGQLPSAVWQTGEPIPPAAWRAYRSLFSPARGSIRFSGASLWIALARTDVRTGTHWIL